MANIVKTAYLGNATPASSFVQETHPSYQKAKNVYTLDVAKAKALFAETGLTSIRLLCTDHGWVKKATPIIKSNLEAAGLTVDFTEKKSSDVYTTIDASPDAFDAVIAPGDPSVFGADADLLLRWWYGTDTWTDKRMHWKGQDSYTQMQELLDKAIKATRVPSSSPSGARCSTSPARSCRCTRCSTASPRPATTARPSPGSSRSR